MFLGVLLVCMSDVCLVVMEVVRRHERGAGRSRGSLCVGGRGCSARPPWPQLVESEETK